MAARPLDLDELRDRLVPAGVTQLRPLTGGASSLTYLAALGPNGARQAVVKVAPPGLAPVLNRDVLRQARLLRALEPAGVPVPRVVWEDPGDPPAIPPLFVMSYIEGSSFEPLFDADGGQDETEVASAFRNAVSAMAALHALDPHTLGLGAEPPIGPEEEISRWCQLLETIDPALVPGWPDVAQRLRSTRPAGARPAVVHGDFRLGNMLTVGPRIAAIVDWEIWAIGDPGVDLGWFLVNAEPATYQRPTRFARTVPPPDELVDIYTRSRGGPVPDPRWFCALACFKSTATWSLIVKHNRRRTAPDPALEEMAPVLPHLLDRAREYLA
jgi:aminoglycoside phosphotransferase (APT) family kinase protein